MAGSHSQARLPQDPVLSARLEALQLLADRMCSRVMVVDRDLTIIYANETGWKGAHAQPRLLQPAKCYEAFLHRSDPCGTCPAHEVFHSGEIRTLSCSAGGDGTSCGMHQVFPLLSSDGKTVKTGTPTVKGAKVSAEIIRHGKGEKVIVFRFKRRKNYRRKTGHRQQFTEIKITGVKAS